MVYLGREEDGTIAAMAVVKNTPMIRKEVAKWVRDGMTIEQVPLSWVKGQKRLLTKDRYIPEQAP